MDDFSPNDPLWELLGQAKPTKPAPFFARNVLRRLHTSQPRVPRVFFRWAWLSVAALITAAFLLTLRPPTADSLNSPDFVEAFNIAADFESLLALDDILSPEGTL